MSGVADKQPTVAVNWMKVINVRLQAVGHANRVEVDPRQVAGFIIQSRVGLVGDVGLDIVRRAFRRPTLRAPDVVDERLTFVINVRGVGDGNEVSRPNLKGFDDRRRNSVADLKRHGLTFGSARWRSSE